MTFKLLSVAENDYKSDSIAAEHRSWKTGGEVVTRIEVTETRHCTIIVTDHSTSRVLPTVKRVEFKELDITSLIEFLKDAEEMISQSDMVKTLKGMK